MAGYENLPTVSEKALEYRVKHEPFSSELVFLEKGCIGFIGTLCKENGRFGVKTDFGEVYYIENKDTLYLSRHYRSNGRTIIRYVPHKFSSILNNFLLEQKI